METQRYLQETMRVRRTVHHVIPSLLEDFDNDVMLERHDVLPDISD